MQFTIVRKPTAWRYAVNIGLLFFVFLFAVVSWIGEANLMNVFRRVIGMFSLVMGFLHIEKVTSVKEELTVDDDYLRIGEYTLPWSDLKSLKVFTGQYGTQLWLRIDDKTGDTLFVQFIDGWLGTLKLKKNAAKNLKNLKAEIKAVKSAKRITRFP